VDPAAYTALLRAAYTAAKQADPSCVILSAGLAPNWETGGKNLNELDFLRRMYQAGAKGYFDVLGAKPYGFWETPEDRRFSPRVLNFSRLVLQREIMEEFGDRDTPVWAVAFGWNALPAGWAGRASTWGSDAEDKQAQRTVQAMQRARMEWPWLGVMTLACFRWAGDPADPVRGFAMVEPDFTPRLLYQTMDRTLHAPPVATPGIHGPANPAIAWGPGWQLGSDETGGITVTGSEGLTTTILFVGTRLDIVQSPFANDVVRALDAVAQSGTGAAVDVALDSGAFARVTLGHPWQKHPDSLVHEATDTLHRADIRVAAGTVSIRSFQVIREKPMPPYDLTIALLLAALAVNLLWLLRRAASTPLAEGEREPRGAVRIFAGMLLALAWYQWIPGDTLALLGLFVLVVLGARRPALLLSLVALTSPFYLSLWRFASVTETLVLVSAAAWVLRAVWMRDGRALLPRRTDLPVLFFVAVGAISLLAAEQRGVALRELRTVVAEPALLFALITRAAGTRRQAGRIADALILAGVLAAAWGLGQFVLGQDIITAEGVWRVRAAYPSPNNLGLFLGRTLPLAVALMLGSPRWRERGLYALAALVTGAGLVLTFSRGAWFGVGVALLFLGVLAGPRVLLSTIGALVAGLLALIPLGRVERISSLLNLQEGTSFLRLKLWQAALDMALDHPLQGVGLDNFLYQYPRYRLPEAWAEPNLSHPHNIVLDWWLRLGVLGLLALAVLLVDFFRRAFRAMRSTDVAARALALGLAASMVDALAHGLIDNSYFLVDLATVFMLTYGLVVVLDRMRGRSSVVS
jgi:O-antigen ligase